MQIRIEIDVKPEELRRFLGIPDVSGLQEDVVAFLREKVGAASDFDATGFVKQNLGSLRKLAARMRAAEVASSETSAGTEPAATAKPASPKRRRATATRSRKKPRKTAD